MCGSLTHYTSLLEVLDEYLQEGHCKPSLDRLQAYLQLS